MPSFRLDRTLDTLPFSLPNATCLDRVVEVEASHLKDPAKPTTGSAYNVNYAQVAPANNVVGTATATYRNHVLNGSPILEEKQEDERCKYLVFGEDTGTFFSLLLCLPNLDLFHLYQACGTNLMMHARRY